MGQVTDDASKHPAPERIGAGPRRMHVHKTARVGSAGGMPRQAQEQMALADARWPPQDRACGAIRLPGLVGQDEELAKLRVVNGLHMRARDLRLPADGMAVERERGPDLLVEG